MPKSARPSAYTRLNFEQKLEVLRKLERGVSVRTLMEEYKVGQSTIYGVKYAKEKFQKIARDQVDGTSSSIALQRTRMCNARSDKLDAAVFDWYKQQRTAGVDLRGTEIRSVAREFAAMLGIENFRASSGWLFKFYARHGIGNKKIQDGASNSNVIYIKEEPSGMVMNEGSIVGSDNDLDKCLPEEEALEEEPLDVRIMEMSRISRTMDLSKKHNSPADSSSLNGSVSVGIPDTTEISHSLHEDSSLPEEVAGGPSGKRILDDHQTEALKKEIESTFLPETEETKDLSTSQLQRLVLLEQLKLIRLQQQVIGHKGAVSISSSDATETSHSLQEYGLTDKVSVGPSRKRKDDDSQHEAVKKEVESDSPQGTKGKIDLSIAQQQRLALLEQLKLVHLQHQINDFKGRANTHIDASKTCTYIPMAFSPF